MATTTGGLVEHYLGEAKRIEELRRQRKKFRNVEAFPFWPHEAVRSTVMVLAFSAAIIYMSALMPYFLEAPANPAGQPEVILPDWYLLWSYGLLKPGVAHEIAIGGSVLNLPILGDVTAKTMGILLNIIITIPLIAMPFISTGHPRRPQEAPWTAAFGVAGIVYVFNVSAYSANNLIFKNITWWGDPLLKLTPIFGVSAGDASWLNLLGSLAFWILPLPIASYAIRRYWLKEPAKFAGIVSAVSVLILFTIIAYNAGLDPVALVTNPHDFLYTGLGGTSPLNAKDKLHVVNHDANLLAWMSWWTTLLAFEVAYWSLVAWKQQSVKQDTYEHGLNLTYFKVR